MPSSTSSAASCVSRTCTRCSRSSTLDGSTLLDPARRPRPAPTGRNERCCSGAPLGVGLEQLHPAGFLLPGLTLELHHHRSIPHRQSGKRGLDRLDSGEVVLPFGSGSQLSHRLRTAQQQDRDDRPGRVVQPQRLVRDMPVPRRPLAADRVHHPQQALPLERERSGLDQLGVVVDHGVTAGRLVARRGERLERQRIGLGGGGLLLHQAAEHPRLRCGQVQHVRYVHHPLRLPHTGLGAAGASDLLPERVAVRVLAHEAGVDDM